MLAFIRVVYSIDCSNKIKTDCYIEFFRWNCANCSRLEFFGSCLRVTARWLIPAVKYHPIMLKFVPVQWHIWVGMPELAQPGLLSIITEASTSVASMVAMPLMLCTLTSYDTLLCILMAGVTTNLQRLHHFTAYVTGFDKTRLPHASSFITSKDHSSM